jgi:hypothetical protein
MDQLDSWLLFDGASQIISTLYLVLRDCPDELRQQRVASDPELFHWPLAVEACGLLHYLDFIICDSWQEGWLHVIGVSRELGGRVF